MRKKLSENYNLAICFPEIAKEWHPSKNGKLFPEDIMPGSGIKRWWQCLKCDESFDMSPNKRTTTDRKKPRGCPVCAGKKVVKGKNDLCTLFPELVKEWHPTKNGILKPEDFSRGSKQEIYWLCARNHVWPAKINSRTNGTGCPDCSNQTSRPELFFYAELKFIFKKVIHRKKILNYEVDIFIKDLNLCIEYDGSFWHKSFKKDSLKKEILANNGYRSINIREKPLKKITEFDLVINPSKKYFDNFTYFLNTLKTHQFVDSKNIKKINKYLKTNSIQNNKEYKRLLVSETGRLTLENNLAEMYPELADMWHNDNNSKPSQVTAFSHDEAKWICKNNHIFIKRIDQMSKKAKNKSKTLCRECNSIAFAYPSLAKEWHPTKNLPMTPNKVSSGSNKEYYWQCAKGHTWPASPNNRKPKKSTPKGRGCKKCYLESKK